MKIKTIAAAAALVFASFGAQAAVLTFDGLGNLYGYGSTGSGMSAAPHSLSYTESGFTLTLWTPNSYEYDSHIGDVSYNQTFNWHDGGDNSYGSYVTLTREGGGAFDLTGFDYSEYYGVTVSAQGYADVTLNGSGYNAMKYLGVTAITFSGNNNYTSLDNMVLTAAANAEVPEPGSVALLLAGLGLVGAVRRRKA